MTPLKNYMQDGASKQARAVLALIQDLEIEESWSDERRCYLAEPNVSRWQNCREQGYVVSLRSQDYTTQFNIAFFEHRNSDSICAVKWFQQTLNSPTIENANFGDSYKDKWDVSFTVGYGEIAQMANWIEAQLCEFWKESKNKSVKDDAAENS